VPYYAHTRKPKSKWLAVLHSILLPVKLRRSICKSDILKTNQMKGSWVVLLSKVLYGKKMILRCGFDYDLNARLRARGRSLIWMIGILSRLSYRYSDRINLTTQRMADRAASRFGADTNKIAVVPNFIDTSRFEPLNLKKNGKVLYVGRLIQQKNVHCLLDSIALTQYELDIIGQGSLRGELEEYARSRKIRANFLGTYPNGELPAIINEYPVYVLSSLHEGHPKSLLEAMACGLAVIGTDVPGIREVIQHGKNGLLCKAEPTSIARAISDLMASEEQRFELGHSARRFAVANLNCDLIADREYRIYSTLVANGGGAK